MTPRTVSTRDELRKALGDRRPGLVPTMGALHEGHRALIERSAAENTCTVVSIFVNPRQFSDAADLARYPRDLARDSQRALAWGGDENLTPDVESIYPPGFDTAIEVGELGQLWEGAARPGHFRGVATVVAILLNLVRPARSYFGEKDYQQLQIIRRLHRDLALSGSVIGCPTVRDEDGLAFSSRNSRLTDSDRLRAQAVPRALDAILDTATKGEQDSATLEAIGRSILSESDLSVDYLTVVDGESLVPIAQLRRGARVLIAAEVGGVRLIDNAAVVGMDNLSC